MLQQRRVLGRGGAYPEVARRLDERLAEDLVPNPIHHHAGGQGVGRTRDGFGQFPSAAALREGLPGAAREQLQVLTRDGLAGASRVAAEEDGAVYRIRFVDHDHRPWRALGVRRLEGFGLADQFAVALGIGGDIRADERLGRRGRRSVRRFDDLRPRLAARFRRLPARAGQQVRVDRREFVELLRHRLGQLDPQRWVDRQVGLRQQLRRQRDGELVVRGGRESGPEPPERVGGFQSRLDDLLPPGEHGGVEGEAFGFLVGVEFGVRERTTQQGEVGGRLGRAKGTFATRGHEVGALFLQAREFSLELLGLLGRRERFEQGFLLRFLRRVEDRVERVVVAGGEGVELVVMAAGAGHGEPLHATHHHVDAVVDDVVLVVEEAST